MRGEEARQPSFVFLGPLEERIPEDHPLRAIRTMTDRALSALSPLFGEIYAQRGRPSIPPEYLLRALLVQVLYAIPSERKLCEHLEFNLLFRWFVGLDLNEPVWHPTTFTQNRERLLEGEVAEAFFGEVKKQAEAEKLLSREHFSCDGTLVEAAASLKSFRPKEERANDKDGAERARVPPSPSRLRVHPATVTLASISAASAAGTKPTPPPPTRKPCLPSTLPARLPVSLTRDTS
jgi:transposase